MSEEQKQPENPVDNPEVVVETSLEDHDSVPESAVELDEDTEINLETDSQTAENEEIFAAFQQENANLKKLLDDKSQQADLAKAQYARLAADFENFRRRTTKEKENLEVQTKKNVISELLPVIDNFERARMQLKPESEGEKTIHSSYQGVYKTLVECLKKMGVSAMRPEGQEFDPNYHEAMLREPTNEYPEGTVIEQLMRGYTIGETILRHAMVKVAVPQEPVITSEQKTTENEENDH
ncbi:MAG: nucleotide exchange factor GrpE [Pleurocapsa sp. SU_5_0]|jgi:molecular chaperone GrpE|nr:nucleotide exchange factor GrpE [Pleurocapsa sp. SU_5_0]NJO94677.1 nucleotide exchange factor GrpE [Pleurocapsa sp. CRU_1_2]NJR44710.1 nucleotide exchange factor GrpE [Hyellaceae cyanobacterium CSU_1_1]